MSRKKSNAVSFAVGFLIMLFSGVFYAWSLFRVELEARFPAWSASAASMNFSLFIIFFCLGGLLGGRLTARLGQMKVARIGAVVVRERFGNANYPSNFSIVNLSGIPASMVGPYVSGLLQDAFGGYQTTFMAMIVFSLIAGAMLTLMAAIERKNKK